MNYNIGIHIIFLYYIKIKLTKYCILTYFNIILYYLKLFLWVINIDTEIVIMKCIELKF